MRFTITILLLAFIGFGANAQRVDQYPAFSNIRTLSAPNSPAAILNDLYINKSGVGAIRANVQGMDSLITLMSKFLQCQCPAPVCESDSFNITQSSLFFAGLETGVVECEDTTYSYFQPSAVFNDEEIQGVFVLFGVGEDDYEGQSLDSLCTGNNYDNNFKVDDLLSVIDTNPYSVSLIVLTQNQDTSVYAQYYDGITSSVLVSSIELVGECKDEVEITYLITGDHETIYFTRMPSMGFINGDPFSPVEFVSTSLQSGKLKLPVQEGKNTFGLYSSELKAYYFFQITASTAAP